MIAAALEEQGVDLPADLLPVDVWPTAAPYRKAFNVLSSSRGAGVSMAGVIPLAIEYSEIVSYAEHNGFAKSITELEEFVMLVQAQDGRYLKLAADARTKK